MFHTTARAIDARQPNSANSADSADTTTELPPRAEHPAIAPPLPSPDMWLTWDTMLAALPHVEAAILRMEEKLAALTPKPDMGKILNLSTSSPQLIEKLGRQYYRLYTTTAIPVIFETPVGPATQSLTIGWNVINLPEGSTMLLSTGNPTNVYALASDHING